MPCHPAGGALEFPFTNAGALRVVLLAARFVALVRRVRGRRRGVPPAMLGRWSPARSMPCSRVSPSEGVLRRSRGMPTPPLPRGVDIRQSQGGGGRHRCIGDQGTPQPSSRLGSLRGPSVTRVGSRRRNLRLLHLCGQDSRRLLAPRSRFRVRIWLRPPAFLPRREGRAQYAAARRMRKTQHAALPLRSPSTGGLRPMTQERCSWRCPSALR